jgi:hypothetical protein
MLSISSLSIEKVDKPQTILIYLFMKRAAQWLLRCLDSKASECGSGRMRFDSIPLERDIYFVQVREKKVSSSISQLPAISG